MSAKKTDDSIPRIAALVEQLNAETAKLAGEGVEVTLAVQRVPVAHWRFLRPIVKPAFKQGRPV